MWEIVQEEFTHGLPDQKRLIQFAVRLIAAAILGAFIGYERERAGKAAGLRTHILVASGTCLVVLACASEQMGLDAQSRVIQGILTGIGFVAGGSILKLHEQRIIEGLTTSAGLWMTSAIGICVGLGSIGLAAFGTLFTVMVLVAMKALDRKGSG